MLPYFLLSLSFNESRVKRVNEWNHSCRVCEILESIFTWLPWLVMLILISLSVKFHHEYQSIFLKLWSLMPGTESEPRSVYKYGFFTPLLRNFQIARRFPTSEFERRIYFIQKKELNRIFCKLLPPLPFEDFTLNEAFSNFFVNCSLVS